MNQHCAEFRYLVCAPHLNAHGSLHGGVLLRWIDEAAGMTARKLTNRVCVTRFMELVNFESKASLGDIARINITLIKSGNTSLTFKATVSEDISNRPIASVSAIVFVSIDHKGNPVSHGIKMAKLV
jgi:acyl-CoA hydrolase